MKESDVKIMLGIADDFHFLAKAILTQINITDITKLNNTKTKYL